MAVTRTVEVTITKRVKVQISDEMASEQNIAEWCSYLWKIDGVDDIAKYAAVLAAQNYGGMVVDGVGELKDTDQPPPNEFMTTFQILDTDIESRVLLEGFDA